uniref:KNOX1 domain-containing protein n=1 Tax=Nelumbo nucifera TaxID=4432 RepID=A0A822Y2X6_NELNU|nr:TPA_asm: hypothetical protein HUJ06_028080 [Nelumbo nucifera]
MENLYSINPTLSCSYEIVEVENVALPLKFRHRLDNLLQFELGEAEICGSEMSDLTKAHIANHPCYPNLVFAYIECRKVGVPPKLASLLEEIGRESYPSGGYSTEIGMDPELDEFMVTVAEEKLAFEFRSPPKLVSLLVQSPPGGWGERA